MSKNLDEISFENLLILKNQLITLSTQKLLDIYENLSNYIKFIDSVICMLQEESAFLFLNEDYIKKIQSVLQAHRFDIDDKEIINTINEITICLNDITCSSDNYRNMLVSSYFEYNKDVRDVNFATMDDFIYMLSYDGIVYLTLKGAVDYSIDDGLLSLSSINYIMSVYPQCFEDININKNTQKKLDEIFNKSSIFELNTKISSYNTKKRIKKIKLKEE